jgi:ketosteroid isomerase-like protein
LNLLIATWIPAQTWSPAEKEVLQAMDQCITAWKDKDLDAWMACHHDDYVSFRYGAPNTWNNDDLRKELSLAWANEDLVEWWIKPLAIRIVGDVAIIHYYDYALYRDKDGKERRSRMRWTDTLVKQGGNWLWIADHGGEDPGVKPSGE